MRKYLLTKVNPGHNSIYALNGLDVSSIQRKESMEAREFRIGQKWKTRGDSTAVIAGFSGGIAGFPVEAERADGGYGTQTNAGQYYEHCDCIHDLVELIEDSNGAGITIEPAPQPAQEPAVQESLIIMPESIAKKADALKEMDQYADRAFADQLIAKLADTQWEPDAIMDRVQRLLDLRKELTF